MEERRKSITTLVDRIKGDDLDGLGDGEVDGERFLRWSAFSVLNFYADEITPETIEESITDQSGDQGLDLFYVDDEKRTVYLVQSKFSSGPGTIRIDEVDTLTQLPARLTDGQALRDATNLRVKDAAFEFRRAVEREDYEVRLIFVTTKHPTQPIIASVDRWNRTDLALGTKGMVEHRLDLFDTNELLKISEVDDIVPDIELEVISGFEYAPKNAAENFLSCLIPAASLIDTFDQHQYSLFNLNPRGPLGPAKVNKEIRETLRDEFDRRNFHYLNNGLTAVCDWFIYSERGDNVRVGNLQIVNGCQTTWNLWDHYRATGDAGLEGVSVLLKLVEAKRSNQLADQVSRTSNAQSPMTDWDFLSGRDDQKRLQREFELLDVFYELKRGEQKYIAGVKQRKVTIKTASQAMWAYLGYPSEALDVLRNIPRSAGNPDEDAPYNIAFFDGVRAAQLLFPVDALNRVTRIWKERHEGETENGRVNRKMHSLWLIGTLVNAALGVQSYRDIPIPQIELMRGRLERWIEPAYDFVSTPIDYAVDRITQNQDDGGEGATMRQAFRSRGFYPIYKREFDARPDLKTEFLGQFQDRLLG